MRCDGNNTFLLYYTANNDSQSEVVCDSFRYYCILPVDAYTQYNMTLVSKNSWQLSSRIVLPSWRSAEKSPAAPQRVRLEPRADQVWLLWNQPTPTRGIIRQYRVNVTGQRSNITQLTPQTAIPINVTANHNYTVTVSLTMTGHALSVLEPDTKLRRPAPALRGHPGAIRKSS